jgi:putative copper resistance protein D
MVVASPPALLAEAADMAGVTWKQAIPLLPEVMRATHAGRIWTWRLPTTAVTLIAAWWPTHRWWKATSLCGLSGLLLVLSSLSGHAIDKGMTAVALYLIHEVAAGLWIGALVGLCSGGGRHDLGSSWVVRIVPGVSHLAAWCVAMLAVAGCYTAYSEIGLNLDTLLYSAYGRTLICKVTIFGVTLSVGGYNRYALAPALQQPSARQILLRNVAVECALLIVVLGVTALLANTPPAH